MQVWEAVALGVVQGLTEFLPISSTGHLLVVRTWMGHPHPEDAFTTVIQLGTVVAVFAYFRADVARLLKALWDDIRAGRPGSTPDARQGWLIVLGTIPAVGVGFILKPWLKATFFNVPSVAVVAIVFALLMAASEWWRARRRAKGNPDRPESDINWKDALFIGCFQCLALMPGGSRSGTTITAGLFAGLSRPAAARFSFLLSLPVVLGCKLVSLYASGLYSRMWSTFGLRDLATVVRGVGGGSVLSVLAVAYAYRFERFSRGVFVIDGALLLLAIVATRTSFRWMAHAFAARNVASRRVLIYGAGANGRLIAREMLENPAIGMTPVAFVDDDPAKVGRHIHGVPVYSAQGSLAELIDRLTVAELLFSTKSIGPVQEAQAVAFCAGRGVKVRRLVFEIR